MMIGTAASILIPNVGQDEPIVVAPKEKEEDFEHVSLDDVDFPDDSKEIEDDFN